MSTGTSGYSGIKKFSKNKTFRNIDGVHPRNGEKSDRNIKRSSERDMVSFNNKVYRFIEKDWWDCVDFYSRKYIYECWYFYCRTYINPTLPDYFGRDQSFLNFIKNKIKNTNGLEVDIIKYRDIKLNKILR